jgi:hypothetical protein
MAKHPTRLAQNIILECLASLLETSSTDDPPPPGYFVLAEPGNTVIDLPAQEYSPTNFNQERTL